MAFKSKMGREGERGGGEGRGLLEVQRYMWDMALELCMCNIEW